MDFFKFVFFATYLYLRIPNEKRKEISAVVYRIKGENIRYFCSINISSDEKDRNILTE